MIELKIDLKNFIFVLNVWHDSKYFFLFLMGEFQWRQKFKTFLDYFTCLISHLKLFNFKFFGVFFGGTIFWFCN